MIVREIIKSTVPMQRTMRFDLEHVELLPDLFFYSRKIQPGWTTDGTDFIEEVFCEDRLNIPMPPMPMPFFMMMGHAARLEESGFVSADGLRTVKNAGVKPLSPDPRLDLGVIHHAQIGRIRTHGTSEARWVDHPKMRDILNENFDPARDIYRQTEFRNRSHGGLLYLRLDGSALPFPVTIHLSTSEETDPKWATGHYGCYDKDRLKAHLDSLEGRVMVTQERDGVAVKWIPRDQAEFDIVWNAAVQSDPEDVRTKDIWGALIATDLLGIAQFKCDPPQRKQDDHGEFKTRLYRLTKKDGIQYLVFAKSPKDAITIATKAGYLSPDDAPSVEDASEETVVSPHKAMRAGLVGIANYHTGFNHGWEASYKGKVTRICDND